MKQTWVGVRAIATLIVVLTFTVAQAQQSCDSSYPSVCIAPAPPDLDCSDIPHRRFEVRLPAPHRFDSDLDGIGCEQD
ncbi:MULTISPECIES: hypothetical protein [Cyanophyceae]|uniref:hypothetical protein n=1 Tax=Cyanophyceae TaxID=3028117 RepID=UPI0018F03C5B|nr:MULTISPECIES: hypothetical protein [Cyanophyceae]